MTVEVEIRCSNGKKVKVDADLSLTVAQWKEKLVDPLGIPADQQRVIYKGRVLKDDQTLESYGVAENHTIHMVRGAARPAPGTAPGTTPISPPNPTNGSPGAVPNPFQMANMMGGSGANAGNFQAMQEQLMNSPELMNSLMDSPMFQQLLSSPEVFQSMLESHPGMQQLMQQNPQFGHILRDPQTLQNTLQMLRNPNARRDMLAHQDQALRNIESHPEGFNALRRMYHEVQEPLMQAATDSSGGSRSLGGASSAFPMPGTPSTASASASASTSSTSNSNTSGAIPNPWALGSSSSTSTTRSNVNPVSGGLLNPWSSVGSGTGSQALPPHNQEAMAESMLNMMQQNPTMQSYMHSMLSNPETIRQMEQMNPQFAALMNANPQMRQMMQNPEYLRTIMDPQNIQAMMQLQRSLNQLSSTGALPNSLNNATTTSTPNGSSSMDFSHFLSMMNAPNGMNAPGSSTGNVNNPVPTSSSGSSPQQMYATQLSQLQDMGFTDEATNIRALQQTFGNVNAAIERLLNGGV